MEIRAYRGGCPGSGGLAALACLLLTSACGPASGPSPADAAGTPTDTGTSHEDTSADAPATSDGGAVIPVQGDIPVKMLWTVQLGSPADGNRTIACLTADPSGNVFFAGRVVGKFDADPGPAAIMMDGGTGRTYLTKLTSEGKHAFTKVFDPTVPSDFGVTSLYCAAAPDGSVRLAGMFRAYPTTPVDFDPGLGVDWLDSGAAGSQHLWVVRVGADGAYEGVRTSSGPANVTLAALAFATDGALWMSGIFEGDPDFDPSSTAAVLHAGRGIPPPRHTFLVRWAADGTTIARDPGDFLFRTIAPTTQGDVILSGSIAAVGVYGGTSGLPATVDLDFGLGVDLNSPLMSRTAYVRARPDASVTWSFGMDASDAIGGTAFADSDGSGVIVGVYSSDYTDFDWGPRDERYDLATRSKADLFAAGFLADGSPSHVSTRAHTILSSYSGPDPQAELSHLAQSPLDGTVYGVGYTGGAVVFPGGTVVGGTQTKAQPYIFAASPKGRFSWAAQLEYDAGLGGPNVPLLATAASGQVVMAGGFAGKADLDFTAGGTDVRDAADGLYVMAFRPIGCAAGETRPCACGYETTPLTVNACVDGRFAGCGCRSGQPGFVAGDRYPLPPPATCATCPAGFHCGEEWLCIPTADPARATGLDHAVELVVAGEDVYAVVQGPYVLPMIGKPAGKVVRLGGGAGPAVVVYTGATPSHLVADGADVWFSDGFSLLKVAAGAAAATVIDSSATNLFGAIAFDANWRFVARSTVPPATGWVIERTLRTAPVGPVGVGDTTVAVAAVVAMLSDGTYLYALDDVALLRVPNISFDASWLRTGRAQGTRGLAMDARYLYYVDSAIGNAIYRYERATGLIDLLIGPILGQLSTPVVEGGGLYVAQAGRPVARTYAGNVFRVDLATRAVTELVPGLNHPSAVALGPSALWVALHGDTRETTSTGAVHRYDR